MERSTPQSTIITTDDTVLCAQLLTPPPRLTPTGKISHAKTRVYTQRYRKEWEQMPDFKGWLNSVPFQPTRAYCIYCMKNLHAHRLSLLKHTCTMKHQRAALAHAVEEKKSISLQKMEIEMVEGTDHQNLGDEGEENDEDIEYVIERLESDVEEAMESQVKEEDVKMALKDEEEEEEEEEEQEKEVDNDLCAQLQSDDECPKPVLKKMKLFNKVRCRDTLAEAMAHVHSEYLEEDIGDQENVQMEMVVEEADNVDMISILPQSTNDSKEMLKESRENGKVLRRSEIKTERKSTGRVVNLVRCQEDSKADLVVPACSMPILGTAIQINAPSTALGTQNSINVVPIGSAQNKTITLTSGGKTLTLTGGTFQPGTQYVLSKIKGKLPTLVMADKKPIVAVNRNDLGRTVQLTKVSQSAVASTSQQLPKLMKSFSTKKLRISTHVVDTTKGIPVGGLQVSLYKLMDGRWTFLNESNTSPNGRCTDLMDNTKLNCTAGRYKIHYDVDKYFTLRRIETLYPFIEIVFDVKNPSGHYHIPVLLSPFGYTTYRGS